MEEQPQKENMIECDNSKQLLVTKTLEKMLYNVFADTLQLN